jgi:hypothetical protein
MNISCSVPIAPPVAVLQVMNSDAALNSVTISETKAHKNHFHIDCLLKGRRHTVKTAAMVDSGATVLFLDKKACRQPKDVAGAVRASNPFIQHQWNSK